LTQPRLAHDEFEAYVEHMMATLIPGASPGAATAG
jgi:hypothetical protein